MKFGLLPIIIIAIVVSSILIISITTINNLKTSPTNTQFYNDISKISDNFFTTPVNISLHSLVYDNTNLTTINLKNVTMNHDEININFHDVIFIFHHMCCAPMPLNAPIPVSLQFQDKTNETLTVIDPQTMNTTIVLLSKHMNPQAGIVSTKNTIQLLVNKH